MSEIVLNDKNFKPDDTVISSIIGTNLKYYKEIKDYIKKSYDNITEEWKFYGQKYGWQLKIFYKKRNLLFIIPSESYFRIVFIFGDKAVERIEDSEISEKLKREVKTAKKYAEGRGISIKVEDENYIEDIKRLIDIKKNN